MSACPARALPPLLPLLFPVHLYDQSLIAVLMMSHSNLLDFKQKQSCYGFMGCPFPVPTSPSAPCLSFLRHPLPVLHGNCTGLSVFACMCAPVYTCIERYICGGRGERGGGGVKLRACSQDTAHWSLSSAPFVLVRLREEGGRALVRPDYPSL
uniref:Uncharacterized protein n=1 Tax=Colobus angolensis palliatus TaxID=336983 RepID=A0A2K5K2V3_COLAP